jgi:hypothetical protein
MLDQINSYCVVLKIDSMYFFFGTSTKQNGQYCPLLLYTVLLKSEYYV